MTSRRVGVPHEDYAFNMRKQIVISDMLIEEIVGTVRPKLKESE